MTTTKVDRAALVRRAMVELVGENGIHGTSMSQVARRAGVAAGTAYVHYASKEELLIAAFAEVKAQLGADALAGVDLAQPPQDIFATLWRRIYLRLRNDPVVARFVTQIDESPLRKRAHDALSGDDPLTALAVDMAPHLVDLPTEVIYELGLAPAVRLISAGVDLTDQQLETVIESCWKAIGS